MLGAASVQKGSKIHDIGHVRSLHGRFDGHDLCHDGHIQSLL